MAAVLGARSIDCVWLSVAIDAMAAVADGSFLLLLVLVVFWCTDAGRASPQMILRVEHVGEGMAEIHN